MPLPPGPPQSRPPRTDIEGLSEKYWGEILERTVSSNSLHALQRVYGSQSHKTNVIDMQQNDRFNGSSNCINNDHLHHHSQTTTAIQLSNFSNSEPKLCEHYHDINCAKTKAYFNNSSRHSIKGLPDI